MSKLKWALTLVLAALVTMTVWIPWTAGQGKPLAEGNDVSQADQSGIATFGNGCFWCTEAVFQRVKGVKEVVSGYSGGTVPNPTYKQVCTGLTGHAEAVQITFDPAQVSYSDLLEIFWKTHDPTTLNQQGPDIGTQYRSAVFYHTDEQKRTAEAYKQQLEESKTFKRPIVTEITEFTNFYPAESYHQDYFELNSRQPYCRQYISPKIKKFNRMFRDKLKDKNDVKGSG
ncbi:MAG: peptide-methionine (S)-S-oxide reductase MsrA [Pirellulaceae bacterium]